MKKILFFSLCIFLYASCATSQNAKVKAEAQKKVDNLKSLIELTETQSQKMVEAEAAFLRDSGKLTYSPKYNTALAELQKKRIGQMKEILTREQFVKFDLIDNNRIKKVPIRAN